MSKKIVILDASTMGEGIQFDCFEPYGEVVVYEKTSRLETLAHIGDASYVFVNKVILDEEILSACPSVEYIGILATGTNNVDLKYCEDHGIVVKNVAGYSTHVVSEHTFALALSLSHQIKSYDAYVSSKAYSRSGVFTATSPVFHELYQKTWGIIGLGAIGRQVASIASAFGCKVVYYSTTASHNDPVYQRVDFDTLLSQCDIISIHAPLTEHTNHLINEQALKKMKNSALLINVGRGPIVDEKALYHALVNGEIAGAGLDVYEKEPMDENNPLLGLDNIVFTPHSAWGSQEARERLLAYALQHFIDFLNK